MPSSSGWRAKSTSYDREHRPEGRRSPHRILHATQPTTAGVARYVAALANHQVRAGLDVHVASPGGGDLPGWLDGAVTQHVWSVPRQPGPAHVRSARKLGAMVGRLHPAAVHLHSAAAGLSGRLVLPGSVPTVFQPHAWSFLAATGPQRKLALSWERSAVRWTDVIVAVSHGEAEQAARAGVAGSVVVIENGIDPDSWPAVDDEGRRAARDRLGLQAGPAVVCVGRLSTQKGQDLLLDAWPRVTAAVPDALLHLVGDDQGLELQRVDGVVLHGHRDDVDDWYAAADVVALPSRWEGLSFTLLEAMATSRPVVTHDIDGCTEVLAHLPDALVKVGDSEGLADALVARLLDRELRDREGRLNREQVVAHYTLEGALETATATTLALINGGREPG